MITLELINKKMGFDLSNKKACRTALEEYYKQDDPWLTDDSKPSIWSRLTLDEKLWVIENGYGPSLVRRD